MMDEGREAEEDPRFYTRCPLRKDRDSIAITVCGKQRCIHLESQDGSLRCGFNLENYRPRGRT